VNMFIIGNVLDVVREDENEGFQSNRRNQQAEVEDAVR